MATPDASPIWPNLEIKVKRERHPIFNWAAVSPVPSSPWSRQTISHYPQLRQEFGWPLLPALATCQIATMGTTSQRTSQRERTRCRSPVGPAWASTGRRRMGRDHRKTAQPGVNHAASWSPEGSRSATKHQQRGLTHLASFGAE